MPKSVKTFMVENEIRFNEITNNIVFCLLESAGKNSGSRFLSKAREKVMDDWNNDYGDKLKAFQTFILPPRLGSVYLADNWTKIGETTGGKVLRTKTIRKKDITDGMKVEERKFKSGETKYLLREYVPSPKKIILVRLSDGRKNEQLRKRRKLD